MAHVVAGVLSCLLHTHTHIHTSHDVDVHNGNVSMPITRLIQCSVICIYIHQLNCNSTSSTTNRVKIVNHEHDWYSTLPIILACRLQRKSPNCFQNTLLYIYITLTLIQDNKPFQVCSYTVVAIMAH